MKKNRLLRSLAVVLCACLGFMTGCTGGGKTDNGTEAKRGLDAYDFTKASFASVDRLGREITPMHKQKTDHERYVGVFYFLWLGTHLSSAGVYDVT